jgi:hypothetical protein
MMERDEFFMDIRERPEQAQQHRKEFYDRRHSPLEFIVGQWVWLRLLHRPIASLDVWGHGKLGLKFYDPYMVIERVGEVAYRLQLSAGARIHDVFHVGLLKPFHGEPPAIPATLPPLHHGRACLELVAILKCRLARGQLEVLVQWQGKPPAETNWMLLGDFRHAYPAFQLEQGLLTQVGRDVMVGTTYARRKNHQPEKQGNKRAAPTDGV